MWHFPLQPGRRPDAATAARLSEDEDGDEPRSAKKPKRKAKRGKKKRVDDDEKEHTGVKIPPCMTFDPDRIDAHYLYEDDD